MTLLLWVALAAPPPASPPIGLLLPLSGPYADLGSVAEAAASGVPGVTLRTFDTRGEAATAAAGVEALAAMGVRAIVGPIGHREAQAAAEAAQRLQIPLIAVSGAPALPQVGHFIFRHRLDADTEASTMAHHAVRGLEMKRLAILWPRTAHGERLMRAFWRTAEALGAEITGAEAYDFEAPRLDAPVQRIIGRIAPFKRSTAWRRRNRKSRRVAMHVRPTIDFDGIYIADGGRRARVLVPLLEHWDVPLALGPFESPAPGRPVTVLGASGFARPGVANRMGDVAPATLFIAGTWPGAEPATDFVARWRARYGHAPPPLALYTADALGHLRGVVDAAASRAQVRDRLAGSRYEGLFGPVRVDADGGFRHALPVLSVVPGEGVVQLGEVDPRSPPPAAPTW